MIKKRFTIKDVAVASGVSTGTVSRYLNSNGYVSQEAQEKIEKAIKEMQYLPSAAARNMVNRKSGLVGIAVPEVNNPFLGDLMAKIEACLSRLGYSVMLCSTAFDAAKTEKFVNDLIMRNAEGVVLASVDLSWTGDELLQKINRFMAGVSVGQKLPNFDSVNYADFELERDVTEYLISMGHRDIACIAYTEHARPTIHRRDGVIEALKRHGLPVQPQRFVGFHADFPTIAGENGGYVCAKRLFSGDTWPTAVIAINDYSALGAYRAIVEKGLRVGEDVSVVGFDNIEMSRFTYPALTTVNCDTAELARVTTELLHSRMTGQSFREPREIILPAQIVYRDSVKKRN